MDSCVRGNDGTGEAMDSRVRGNDGSKEAFGNDVPRIISFAEFNQCCNWINAIMQVAPLGIERFDHVDLPLPQPFLELLFPLDGVLHCMMVLIPDELLDPVFLSEALYRSVLVGCHTVP